MKMQTQTKITTASFRSTSNMKIFISTTIVERTKQLSTINKALNIIIGYYILGGGYCILLGGLISSLSGSKNYNRERQLSTISKALNNFIIA